MTNISLKKRRRSATWNRGTAATSKPNISNLKAMAIGLLTGAIVTCSVFFLSAPSGSIVQKKVSSMPKENKLSNEITVEPRFEFYSELVDKPATTNLKNPVTPIDKYLVQAGSFRSRTDADALKAKLTLNGLEAKVAMINTSADNIWYRVFLGPYATAELANQELILLKTFEIDALIVQKQD